ncbi:MAG: trans-4-hydroxy-L-proline dehydratase [Gemmatimonadales bacterium]|jgi:formate C-acetyltransferase
MTARVARLRQESLDARPCVSTERAELMTAFYRDHTGPLPAPLLRARAFAHLLEHKAIRLGEGELIVGEKGPAPKATPTYPELCCHSLADLDLLNSREKIPFAVSAEARAIYEKEIIPSWRGRSMRDHLFAAMTDEWKAAYAAGVFTEFMEQRAPGHTVLDDKIYRRGLLEAVDDIDARLQTLRRAHGDEERAQRDELEAMRIAALALIRFAERHAERARELATAEKDAARRAELLRIAEVCTRVPAHAPRDFWEAIQAYWFVHLGVTTELNTWDAFSPGRLDQHLWPFYRAGLADGTLTRERAAELLQCLWIKFNNQPAPPKVGVTAEESGTYTDFAQVNLGGTRADGGDGVNDLTFLMLDVVEEMRLLQPSASLQVCAQAPDAAIERAARIIRTGFGQPSIFNHDLIVRELVRQGKALEDARNGGSSGCVEVGAFGKENYNLTGYFNLPKLVELTLHDGVDPRTGKQLGPKTGDPRSFQSFDDLFAAWQKQVRFFVDIKTKGNDAVERLYAERMPAPFLSLLIDDCIKAGRDYHGGGARYNTSYIQGVGIGTTTDALTAFKYHVFDRRDVAMDTLLGALEKDFNGAERLRQLLLNRTPRYGNDDPYADDVMLRVFETVVAAIDGRPNVRGGEYHVNWLPTTVHVYFGSVIGALPDGRRALTPVSEGVSPVQGADRLGPTAVMQSVAKMDHARTGGTLLNQKFTPALLADDAGLAGLVNLVRGYFRLGGHHVQFNVVDAATLRDAQVHPELHRDLIVRVAGYSDYFCDLGKALQDEIIARTEQPAS